MCIVIDINVIANVFNEESENHTSFFPVKKWIDSKEGVLVFGGSSYIDELKKMPRYMKLVRLLHDDGRAVRIKNCVVDKLEKGVIEKTSGTKCNDPHIIALLDASRCPLLCSNDSRSFEFIKNRNLYTNRRPKVKIYTSIKNISLLKKLNPESLSNVEN